MDAAQRIDEGLPVPAQLEEIFAEGSALGGARPKATVRDEERVLWLAKFPSGRMRCWFPFLRRRRCDWRPPRVSPFLRSGWFILVPGP